MGGSREEPALEKSGAGTHPRRGAFGNLGKQCVTLAAHIRRWIWGEISLLTTTRSSHIIARMYDTSGPQAETTAEQRKPPTLADIVREKTDDGRLIIDFFIDVMEARVEGAELCHRIDAARQLVKYGSKDAARFIARYRGVPCGHSTGGRPNPADPCSNADATARESAPASFTQDFLTVLSAVDEDLMARLVRAQTADGFTVIEFLDDVMQDRNEGFKPYHRIAAAKELIVHIVRDEQPGPIPGEAPTSAHPELVEGPAEAPTSAHPELVEGPSSVHPEPVLSTVEGPAEAPSSVRPEPVEGAGPDDPAHTTVIPAEAGTHPRPRQARPEPAEGPQDTVRRTRRRRTRKQRRQAGTARAAIRGKALGSERPPNEEQQDKPAPLELTPAERRIREKLEAHWHEPDPYGAPIDSTTPGRSPPW